MEAVYVGLTGREQTNAEMPFGELLGRLIGLAGTKKAAAEILGVSPTTVYRWSTGRQKPKTGSTVLARAIRRLSLKPDLERDIRNKTKVMRISGLVHVSDDVRTRTLNVGRYIPARKIGNVLNAWLDADDTRASRLLWKAIDTHYAEGIEIDTVTRVDFA